MKTNIINRICTVVIASLMCIFLVFYPFVFTSSYAYASNVDLGSELFDFAKTLVDDGLLPGTTDAGGVHFNSPDFDAFQKYFTDVHYPMGGSFVSANNEHKGIHLIPTHSTPVFCQPYLVSHGSYYFASTGMLFTDGGYGKCGCSQSSIEDFSPQYYLKYSYYNLCCGILESAQRLTSYVYYTNDVTQHSNFSGCSGGYSPTSFDHTGFASLSLVGIDFSDITDFGYVIGAVDNIFSVPPGLGSMPDNGVFNVPKGASSFSQLTYTIDGVTYSSDGDPVDNPVDDPADDIGNSSGSLSGNITVGGKVDVNISVPDININVNDGNSTENPNDYIDPGEVDTNLDTYLQHVPEVSKNFIDYLKDFFEWLPPPVFGILMLGLIVAVWCRLAGR